MIGLYDRVDFRFHVNYHSFGELLLYSFGYQVNTPSADDPIFVALSGTDQKPAIDGFNPGVGADLYTTNGETTDFAHAMRNTLAWTPELGDGPHDDGFVFPDKEGQVQSEFSKTLPFALVVAQVGRSTPTTPSPTRRSRSSRSTSTSPSIDPQKSLEPDERLPVRVLVQRRQPAGADPRQARHDGDGHADPVIVALLDQRRADADGTDGGVGRRRPLRRAGRRLLPHRPRHGHRRGRGPKRARSGSPVAVRPATRSPSRWSSARRRTCWWSRPRTTSGTSNEPAVCLGDGTELPLATTPTR